jgi:hypothetical protein
VIIPSNTSIFKRGLAAAKYIVWDIIIAVLQKEICDSHIALRSTECHDTLVSISCDFLYIDPPASTGTLWVKDAAVPYLVLYTVCKALMKD